jgi:peptide/nickel transport system substrate-binding protein
VFVVGIAVIFFASAYVQGDAQRENELRGDQEPQYGGTLDIATVNVTLSALSWDPADWTWKSNHDAGAMREQLLAADLEKSVRKGGIYPFRAEAFLPEDSLRGELAESWEWEDPLTLVVHLRRGVMFPSKPGVMEERELDAADVVWSYNYVDQSPRQIPTYFDHIGSVVARDKHTVVFYFTEYNAEWSYRFGYGFHSGISPREMEHVDKKDWNLVTGSGPFLLGKYIHGNSHTYTRNPIYWDKETLGSQRYAIPFVDEVKYRVIKDEATALTALRTAKIDIMENVRWIAVEHLKETTPELQWSRWLATGGNFLVMRVDKEPFDDVRVRRALNLAVNQREIVDLFYGGYAELMAYPQHPGFGEYFQPLDEMPDSVKELFEYNPEKAKRLLAEAGLPDGFSFEVQVCSCSPSDMDLVPLLEGYFAQIGVSMSIQPMEYASFLSLMTTRNHGPGYLMGSGHTTPITSIRKSFKTGQTWNPSQWSDPKFDEKIRVLHLERDEATRVAMVRQMTVEMLEKAPYVWLPTQYFHTAWWPWVKNYGGELRAGAVRPAPIYARIWMDLEMKAEMGF